MRLISSLLFFGALSSCSALNDFFEPQRAEASRVLVSHVIPHLQQQIQNIRSFQFHQFEKDQLFAPLDVTVAPTDNTATGTSQTTGTASAGTATGTAASGSVPAATSSVATNTVSTCLAAFASFQTAATSCGLYTTPSPTTMAPTGIPPTSSNFDVANQIAALCNSATCDFKGLQASASNVFTACAPFINQADVSSALASFTKLNQFISVGCTKDSNGNLCLKQFLDASAQLSHLGDAFQSGTAISTQILDTLCSSCSLTVMNVISTFSFNGQDQTALYAASLNVLCVKDPSNPSNYCVNTFLSSGLIQPTSAGGTTVSPFANPNLANALCSPCVSRMFASIGSLMNIVPTTPGSTASNAPNFNAISNLLSALCTTNSNGQRCITLFSQFATQGAVAFAQCEKDIVLAGYKSCPASCSNILNGFGCCLGSIFNAVTGLSGGSSSSNLPTNFPTVATVATTSNPIFATCGVSFTSTCPAFSSPISVTIKIPQLNYNFCSGHADACSAKLRADVANAAFVDVTQVTVIISPDGNGGTTVQASITKFNSASDANAVSNLLNSKLTSTSGFPLPSTSQYAATNGQSTAPLSGSGTSVAPAGSSASQVTFSAFALLSGLVAYALMQ